MNSHWNRALVALAFAVVAPLSVAQTITVNPAGNVLGGTSVNVSFKDASQPGKSITITIDNGDLGPFREVVTVIIKLDNAGKGSASWTANPNWDQAVISGGGAAEVSILID